MTIHDDADSDLDPTFPTTKLVKLLNNWDTSVFLIPKNYLITIVQKKIINITRNIQ